MKKIMLLIAYSLIMLITQAQTTKPTKQENPFEDSLTKIIVDFKNNFHNIQSAALPAEIDADTYRSAICLPGATHCTIMRYHSKVENSASWQAILFSGENFGDALKAYKKIFDLIKKTKIKGIDDRPGDFEGMLEQPDENVRFAVSSLRLNVQDIKYINFVADIELLNNYDGWEVHLNLYKKKKDTEGGDGQL